MFLPIYKSFVLSTQQIAFLPHQRSQISSYKRKESYCWNFFFSFSQVYIGEQTKQYI